MADISAELVKELRERTGAGFMDCKKALTQTEGDLEAAVAEGSTMLRVGTALFGPRPRTG